MPMVERHWGGSHALHIFYHDTQRLGHCECKVFTDSSLKKKKTSRTCNTQLRKLEISHRHIHIGIILNTCRSSESFVVCVRFTSRCEFVKREHRRITEGGRACFFVKCPDERVHRMNRRNTASMLVREQLLEKKCTVLMKTI